VVSIVSENAIHIKDARGWYRQLVLTIGFVCGLCGPLAISAAIGGDWCGAAVCAGIPVVLGCLSLFVSRLAPKDVAILFRDGMALPSNKMQPEFQWADVEKIRWPRGRDQNGSFYVRLSLANKSRVFCKIPLDASSVSLADRLTLIRYLRLVGANIPHENWPTFCEWCAVPAVEECRAQTAQRTLRETAVASEKSRAGALLRRLFTVGEWSPFWLGVFIMWSLPLVCLLYLATMAPRRTWWVIAVLLGLSATINLPLLLGWNVHVATLVIAIPSVLLLLGLFAPPVSKTARDRTHHVRGGTALVVAIVFGFPFLLAAGANGWIPATVVIYALLGLWLAMPIFMTVDSRRRKQVQDMDREEREAVALRRWAEFEETE
jgi:hypothetical protein